MRGTKKLGLIGLVLLCAIVGELSGCGVPVEVETTAPPDTIEVLAEPQDTRPLVTQEAAGDVQAVVAGNADFAFDLLRVSDADADGNLVYSPYGLSVALAMLVAGTQGPTQSEITQALHLDLKPHRLHAAMNALGVSLDAVAGLTTASAMWGQNNLEYRDSFLDLLSSEYRASVRLVDFGDYGSVAEDINSWVKEETQGHIAELVSPNEPRPDTIVAMLVNAICMSATWEQPFMTADTRKYPFHLANGSTVDVATMNQTVGARYFVDDRLEAVELPYADGRLSMVILAPRPGRYAEYAANASATELQGMLARMREGAIDLRLPKFRISVALDLIGALEELGVVTAFAETADFSGMLTNGQGEVSGIRQKALIVVDEAGTEAAAATGVTVAAGIQEAEATIAFDRPFIFMVRDCLTGAILFMGRVANPLVDSL